MDNASRQKTGDALWEDYVKEIETFVDSLLYPGSDLDMPDEAARELKTAFSNAEGEMVLGISALLMYGDAQVKFVKYEDDCKSRGVAPRQDMPVYYSACRGMRITAARSFVSSLHIVREMIQRLISESPNGGHAKASLAAFDQKYPDIQKVRDSIQHTHERARGERRHKGKPKKIGVHLIQINNIVDHYYETMLSDGTQGRVPIGPEVLNDLLGVFQCTIDAFPWTGAGRLWPEDRRRL
uniref:hypothetical protein n=1 Tax=Azospirillum argentinense TaxID=2970906 RepID=UPI0010BF772B|nr:hypothetical protein [Azospirillum argentinense]